MIRLCGPKCSMCCLITSVWGVIMLVMMGIFLKARALAFFPDMGLSYDDIKSDPAGEIGKAYDQAAYNCFLAAFLYLLFIGLSAWQWRVNKRVQYIMN